MAWIDITWPAEAEGKLKETYEDIFLDEEAMAEGVAVQSLKPDVMMRSTELAREILYKASELSRTQVELIHYFVSTLNECEY